MELNSLVSMFDELEVDDCLSIEGGSQNVAGVVVGIITVGVIGVFMSKLLIVPPVVVN